mgnify:FL=1|jgi:hypothetical protein|tara:strand:+ start:167 stop:367 length:201 start_codon:yes stop_codon:yes gene_type:complete
MGYQVSRCCGTDYDECGDEDRFNFYVCVSCNQEFDDPIMDYDYKDMAKSERKESHKEDRPFIIPFG